MDGEGREEKIRRTDCLLPAQKCCIDRPPCLSRLVLLRAERPVSRFQQSNLYMHRQELVVYVQVCTVVCGYISIYICTRTDLGMLCEYVEA